MAKSSSDWMHIRLDPELKPLLRKVVQARGECMSSFVRRSIKKELARLSFLPEEDKKALEVTND